MSASETGAPRPSGWTVAAVLTGLLLLAYTMRLVLLPLAFAAALAYVLRPAVKWLQRRLHVPHILAVLLVYFGAIACLSLAGWWVFLEFGDYVMAAASDPATLSANVRRLLGPEVHFFGRTMSTDDLTKRAIDAVGSWLAQPMPILLAGSVVVAGPVTVVLMLVVTFYFLNAGRELAEGVLWLAPPPYRPRLKSYYRRVDPMLRLYVRGVCLVVLYTSTAAWLVLGLWFRLPFALFLSVLVGVLELVPVIGPATSIALIGIAGVLNGSGLWHFVGFMVFAVALRVSIDELVGPLVLGRAVTLHPVVIIIAFLIGSTLFGVIGVLFAVPAAAATKIVLGAIYEEYDQAQAPPEPAPVEPASRR